MRVCVWGGGGGRENSKGGTTREDTIGGGGTGGSCALSRPARGYGERWKLPQLLCKIAFQNHHLFYHHHFHILSLFAVGCQRNFIGFEHSAVDSVGVLHGVSGQYIYV